MAIAQSLVSNLQSVTHHNVPGRSRSASCFLPPLPPLLSIFPSCLSSESQISLERQIIQNKVDFISRFIVIHLYISHLDDCCLIHMIIAKFSS